MRFRTIWWVVAIGSLLFLTSCSGGSGDGAANTATSPPIAPTATEEATTPQAASLPGNAVFRRDGDLFIAPLDGSTEPRQLTDGAVNVGFAGYVTNPGEIDIYYIEQLTEERLENEAYVSDQVLYRMALDGGEPEELLRYAGRSLESFFGMTAAVSPDGLHVLYSDARGISLLNTASGEMRQLLERSPPCTGTVNCYAYHRPAWSPDGALASIAKSFWEGGRDIIIDPFADPIVERETPGGATLMARWSPDGEHLCVSENTYSSAGAALVYELATGETIDSTQDLSLPTPEEGRLRIDTRGCVWSDSGDLAFAYTEPDNFTDVWIATTNASFEIVHESESVPDLDNLVDWLPDGSGVVFNRWQRQQGERFEPGIFDFERGILDLPFGTAEVLAIIP